MSCRAYASVLAAECFAAKSRTHLYGHLLRCRFCTQSGEKTGGIHMDTLEHMSIHPGAVNVLSNATSIVSRN
eukprot:SAG22_NODE_18632_length_283_cov_129.690217_1_plen_71_part_01